MHRNYVPLFAAMVYVVGLSPLRVIAADIDCKDVPEITIGLIGELTLPDYASTLSMVVGGVMWDIDLRKNFEPDLVARYGPPIFDFGGTLHPCLRVRPLLFQATSPANPVGDFRIEEFALWSARKLSSGQNGFPVVKGFITDNGKELSTAVISYAHSINFPVLGGAPYTEFDDEKKYPLFFRFFLGDALQAKLMWWYTVHFKFRSVIVHHGISIEGDGLLKILNSKALEEKKSHLLFVVSYKPTLTVEEARDGHDMSPALCEYTVRAVQKLPSRVVLVAGTSETLTLTQIKLGVWMPKYQYVFGQSGWRLKVFNGADPTFLSYNPHAFAFLPLFDAIFAKTLAMWLQIGNAEILNGTSRYMFDEWHPDLLSESPPQFPPELLGQFDLNSMAFLAGFGNAFFTYVHAFNKLMNDGYAVDDMHGELLINALSEVNFPGVWSDVAYDANKDAIWTMCVYDFRSSGPFPVYGGVFAVPMIKSFDGITTQDIEIKWADGTTNWTAPNALRSCQPGMFLIEESCEFCPPGFASFDYDSQCEACPAGKIPNDDKSACIPCEPGTDAQDAGSSFCLPCQRGKATNESGSIACISCERGKYANRTGLLRCSNCEVGETTARLGSESQSECVCATGWYNTGLSQYRHCLNCPEKSTTTGLGQTGFKSCVCERDHYMDGGEVCVPCPENSFTAGHGMTTLSECSCVKDFYMSDGRCVACPALSSTEQKGSTNLSQCSCQANSYMSNEVCVSCPGGSSTSGAGKTNVASCLCDKGTYMQLGGSKCETCKIGMACERGSSEANLNTEILSIDAGRRTGEQQIPILKPGFWSELGGYGPLSVFVCKNDLKCVGGDPYKNEMCAKHLGSRACEYCDYGYSWAGDSCVECASVETSKFLFPIGSIVCIIFVVIVLYKKGGDPLAQWGSWKNTCACIAFILINHYQNLDYIGTAFIPISKINSDFIDLFGWTNNMESVFKLDCPGQAGLVGSILIGAFAPIAVVICAAILMLMSRIAGRHNPLLQMKVNRTLNVVGSLMYTFFSAISAKAFMLFKCGNNPNGLLTNLADYSIVCYESDTWKEMLAVTIGCVVIFVFGLGTMFLYAIVKAPCGYFPEASFQTRWKFLFIKYHSEAYYWGAVHLSKNIILNLCFVITSSGVLQLFFCATTLTVYGAGLYFVRPYRGMICSSMEVLCIASLVLAVLILTYIGAELMSSDGPLDVMAYMQLVVSSTPAMAGLCGILWLMRQHLSSHDALKEKEEHRFRQVLSVFRDFTNMEREDARDFFCSLGELDQSVLMHASEMITGELHGHVQFKRLTAGRFKKFQMTRVSSTEALKYIKTLARASRKSAADDFSLFGSNGLGSSSLGETMTRPTSALARVDSLKSVESTSTYLDIQATATETQGNENNDEVGTDPQSPKWISTVV